MHKIEQISKQIESLEIDHSRKQWTMYTAGFDLGCEDSQNKILSVLKDKENYAVVCNALQSADKKNTTDITEKRGLHLLHKKFKVHHYSDKANALFEKMTQLERSLTDLLNKHRAVLNGKETTSTDISKIITENLDREKRKQAYLSRTQVNRKLVDAGFLQLVELRKEYAQACTGQDYVSFRLQEDELTSEVFSAWPSECKKRTAKLHNLESQLAQKHLQAESIEAWDFGFLENRVCAYNLRKVDIGNFYEPIEKTFAAYGFDLSQLNLTFDIFPRKNKSEWGYNFTLSPGVDSRILANVNDRFSSFWVLLHETAHGVHFLGLDPEQRLLNMGVSGIVAEGFANYFGNLSYSPEFLSEIFGEESTKAHEQFSHLQKVRQRKNFDALATTLFDQDLYRKPLRNLQDINDLKWQTQKELLGKDPYADEPVWGYLIHHTVAPIYLHNYFLGDVMCENMKLIFQKHTGKSSETSAKDFGQFWQSKVLKASGSLPFLDLFEKVCEQPLTIGAFLDQCLANESPAKI